MASPFAALDQAVSRVIERVNGEAVLFRPMQRVANGRPAADPERAELALVGILEWSAERGRLNLPQSSRELRTEAAGRGPVLSVDRRWFAGAASEPRAGDRFEASARPGVPVFEAVSVERDGLARLVCRLVQLGGQT